MGNDGRPDPDKLLAELKEQEKSELRGKLKIFFGACAGVGKTYAMLSAAQQRLAEGVDVVVGIVETHGRVETKKLLENLPIIPLRQIEYRGKPRDEFDIDAALKRHPKIIVVDELAHSNVSGSRHEKRWQDVEELLNSGIDVYTTLNVQHIDSLNDVVGSITGVRVWETVPDQFFYQANDVTLVDLPPDELLARLQEGKVYMPEQAQAAAKNFFRKGNLIALREMALRRTADRVDSQMRDYRLDTAVSNVWEARERIMICVGPDTAGDKLVRNAARLARDLHADSIAVYVETPELAHLDKKDRERIMNHLRVASELGAETATLAGTDIVATLIAYARSRNVNKIVLASKRLVNALTKHAPDLDIYIVGIESNVRFKSHLLATGQFQWKDYIFATLAGAVTTLFAEGFAHIFQLSNVVMLYLLMVSAVSAKFGRGPGAWAATLSVLLFDFFFVPPKYSLTVSDPQYLITFSMMLLVALFIGQLTANFRYEARIAHLREQRAIALTNLSKELSGALVFEQVVEIAHRHLSGLLLSQVAVLLPDSNDKIQIANSSIPQSIIDLSVAQWVYDHQQSAGFGTHTLSGAVLHYLPLKAPMRTRGVLALEVKDHNYLDQPEEKRLIDTFAAQIALALERVHYVEVARDAIVTMESERMQNNLKSLLEKLNDQLAHSELTEEAVQSITEAIQVEVEKIQSMKIHLEKP